MANRLKDATSPYLLQHADNPVDWWPWCDEAFEEARRRDVPVMLSVGYAACHWCHVMSHQSFEDPETARIVNENVVAIKVDREERPDVDAVYMAATQGMTGQGGWPMTVFATPDGEPFHCGTYYPREHFQRLIAAVATAWRDNRAALTGQAEKVSAALTENAAALAGLGSDENLQGIAERAVENLAATYDSAHGGFGSAPKFPPSMVLEFLLRHYERTGSAEALRMAEQTCEAMARGGIYDQIGGGFARYSVDATWTVPHFEKMLYDNALLARVYLHLWRRTGSELGRRVAEETCGWMIRELRTESGGLASSLDADSLDGSGHLEEGAFYVWTSAELREVLGPDDAEYACKAFGVTETGTFSRGASVLQVPGSRGEQGSSPGGEQGSSPGGEQGSSQRDERLDRIRGQLAVVRDGRPRPGRDDKVVAAWNGMALAALAEAGLLLARPDFIAAALDIADLLTGAHMSGDRLTRTSRDGIVGTGSGGTTPGQLDDYACVASGLLVLSGVTAEGRWVSVARNLLEAILAHFGNGEGGFYDSPDDGEQLIFRPADPADNATPSGAFAAADALLSYAALTGSSQHLEAAQRALGAAGPIAGRYPRAAGSGLSVATALLTGPAEIAVLGPLDDPRTTDLLRTALHSSSPGAVLAAGMVPYVPLLEGRTLVNEAPAAYVCRNFTCQLPVTTPGDLRAQLPAPLV
jgi:uncharacterized protein YyaL (SSP411 family)